MGLLLLEALGALLLLLLIVWWTMFCGRRKGELPSAPASSAEDASNTPHTPDARGPSRHG